MSASLGKYKYKNAKGNGMNARATDHENVRGMEKNHEHWKDPIRGDVVPNSFGTNVDTAPVDMSLTSGLSLSSILMAPSIIGADIGKIISGEASGSLTEQDKNLVIPAIVNIFLTGYIANMMYEPSQPLGSWGFGVSALGQVTYGILFR